MKITLVLVFSMVAGTVSAQELRVEKSKFYDGERLLKVSEYVELLKTNPEAYNLGLKAKSGYNAGNVLGFIGGFMIGWPLGTALGGGDPNWALLGAGGAVLAVGIPIQSSATKKLKKATEIYNGVSSEPTARLNLRFQGTGAGIVFSF